MMDKRWTRWDELRLQVGVRWDMFCIERGPYIVLVVALLVIGGPLNWVLPDAVQREIGHPLLMALWAVLVCVGYWGCIATFGMSLAESEMRARGVPVGVYTDVLFWFSVVLTVASFLLLASGVVTWLGRWLF